MVFLPDEKLDMEDLEDLLPILVLARLNTTGTLNDLQVTESILRVVNRHVGKVLNSVLD